MVFAPIRHETPTVQANTVIDATIDATLTWRTPTNTVMLTPYFTQQAPSLLLPHFRIWLIRGEAKAGLRYEIQERPIPLNG